MFCQYYFISSPHPGKSFSAKPRHYVILPINTSTCIFNEYLKKKHNHVQLFHLIKLIIPQYHLIWLLSCFFFFRSESKQGLHITFNDCASNHLYNNLSSIKKKSHWFAKEMSFICLINSSTGFGRWGPRGIVSPVRYTLCFLWPGGYCQPLAIFKYVGFGQNSSQVVPCLARTGQWTWVEAVLSLQDPTSWL